MAKMIGLNSGTSLDGIDAVLIEVELGADGQPTPPRFLHGLSTDWPREVEKVMLEAFANKVDMEGLGRLNYVAGAVFAEAARKLMDELNLDPSEVAGIGVDGQTIYQEQPDHTRIDAMTPEERADLVGRWFNGPYPMCYQLAESNVIAAHTQVSTVTHFRQADHAYGGNGAPMMQYLDWVMFRDKAPALTLNIGGIANIQYVEYDRSKMIAFDTGPGNVLLDHAGRELFDTGFDKDGALSAAGTVDQAMLDDLLQHPFFSRKLPRSAWRNDFSSSYGDSVLEKYRHLDRHDIMATFCAFTAEAIVRSMRDNVPDLGRLSEVVASGGGVFNPTLMRAVEERLPGGLGLVTSDKYGIPPQYKEAVKFATLGFAALNGVANNIPAASHADHYAVMGKIAVAPRHAAAAGRLPGDRRNW